MDKVKLAELKQRLLDQKKQLEQALAEIAVKDKNLKDDYDAKYKNFDSGPMDHSAEAQEVSEYQVNLSLEANLELQLRDVNDALEDMEKGNYGKCKQCGQEIKTERLQAIPHARVCLKCVKS